MRADLFRYEGDRGGGETPYAKARGALEQAAALAKESGDATAEGKVLLAMGRLCSSRNDLELATRTWGLAASKFMESGDKPMLAVTEDLLRDADAKLATRRERMVAINSMSHDHPDLSKVREAFRAFDADGTGAIRREDMGQFLASFGSVPPLAQDEVDEVVSQMARGGGTGGGSGGGMGGEAAVPARDTLFFEDIWAWWLSTRALEGR